MAFVSVASADNSSTKLDTFIPRVITHSFKKGARRVLRPLELASASPRIAGPVYHAIILGRARFELWARGLLFLDSPISFLASVMKVFLNPRHNIKFSILISFKESRSYLFEIYHVFTYKGESIRQRITGRSFLRDGLLCGNDRIRYSLVNRRPSSKRNIGKF